MNTIYFVTGNNDKFEDVRHFFDQHCQDIAIKQCDIDLEEIQSLDLEAVAVDKARKAWQRLKHPVLIDDGGFFVEKYNNFPGVFSKFVFQGIGLDGFLKLVEHGDKAHFQLKLVYYYGDNMYQVFDGVSHGTVFLHNTGTDVPSKLPYTKLFKPDGADASLETLRQKGEHHAYTHRGQALQAFVTWYAQHNK
jgi:non-canonical purine NTP pyrophosphatase (RdgB/HAM1 family)